MRRFSVFPPFQTSSDNISLDRGDEGFADARIVNISAAPTMNCMAYSRVCLVSFSAKYEYMNSCSPCQLSDPIWRIQNFPTALMRKSAHVVVVGNWVAYNSYWFPRSQEESRGFWLESFRCNFQVDLGKHMHESWLFYWIIVGLIIKHILHIRSVMRVVNQSVFEVQI